MVGIVGFSLAPILRAPGGIGNNGIRRGRIFFVIRNCNSRSSSTGFSSTTTVEAAACGTESNFLVDYLTESHRFSRDDAILVAAKVINHKSQRDPTLVLDYLKQIGMEATHIKNAVSMYPKILFIDVDKNIRPKIQCLEELGLSGPDIVKLIAIDPRFLHRGLDSHLRPTLRSLVQAVGTNKNAVEVIKRYGRLLSHGSFKSITENLTVLQDLGLSDEIGKKSGWVYGAVCAATSMRKSTMEKKIKILRSFGWSNSDISMLLQKQANFMHLSENRVKKVLSFFMKEHGYGPQYLAFRPRLLMSSLEKKTIPRSEVLKILRENRLTQCSLFTAVAMSESKFFGDFVLPYKDMFPDMYQRYVSSPSPSTRWALRRKV